MSCPFETGERILEEGTGYLATVTHTTETTFSYEFEQPVVIVARWNWTATGGVCYQAGFSGWKKAPPKLQVRKGPEVAHQLSVGSPAAPAAGDH